MTVCRTVIDGTRCATQAAYRVVLNDCTICAAAGFLACFGHAVCIRDAAELRAGALYPMGSTAPALVDHIRAAA